MVPTTTSRSSGTTKYRRVASPADLKYDRARFYTIDGMRLPSVTTVLDVINKPALGPWYAKMERQAFETALLTVAAQNPMGISADHLLDVVISATSGAKAGDREKQKAADVGTAAHAWIEWETRRMITGTPPGPEPVIGDASRVAVMAWQDWSKSVGFNPIWAESTVHSKRYGYAGTCDWVAAVNGVLTLGDYKTSKAIYPEAFLQNIAYREAVKEMGVSVQRGVIVRLPKLIEDPGFEAMEVPEVDVRDFLAALRLWRCMRVLEGKSPGDLPEPLLS